MTRLLQVYYIGNNIGVRNNHRFGVIRSSAPKHKQERLSKVNKPAIKQNHLDDNGVCFSYVALKSAGKIDHVQGSLNHSSQWCCHFDYNSEVNLLSILVIFPVFFTFWGFLLSFAFFFSPEPIDQQVNKPKPKMKKIRLTENQSVIGWMKVIAGSGGRYWQAKASR